MKHRILLKNHQKILDGIRTTHDINGIMLPKFHDTSPITHSSTRRTAKVDKVPVQSYGRPVHAQEMFLQRGQCALNQVLRMFF